MLIQSYNYTVQYKIFYGNRTKSEKHIIQLQVFYYYYNTYMKKYTALLISVSINVWLRRLTTRLVSGLLNHVKFNITILIKNI